MTDYSHKSLLLLLLTAFMLGGCSSKKSSDVYVEKEITLPPDATLEEKLSLASCLVPTKEQREWQDLELTAFVHFGVNTFTGKEWGDGTEDPKIFSPEDLDTDQWVRALKEGGFKMVILTAKHHDGFCLWPTKTTEHSVRSSSWQDGHGDVLSALRASCDKYGMKLGVYLSPWDRNSPLYGQGEAYNDLYIEQLKEILTHYGKIDEVWFDGANGEGPNGKKQSYDFKRILETVHELQPHAVTAIMGSDVRWVGNENGLGRETEWSVCALSPLAAEGGKENNERLGIEEKSKDLGSRELIEKAHKLFWYPSEVDVSIRPGWFYHPREDEQVKSLSELVNIYFHSVGMNSVLLLNVPPMPGGKLAEEDVARLAEFGEYISRMHSQDYVKTLGKMKLLSDGTATIEAELSAGTWDVICLQEDIEKGQRIESFSVEVYRNGSWELLTQATTIGYKRLLPLYTPTEGERLRVIIHSYRGERPYLKALHLYRKPSL